MADGVTVTGATTTGSGTGSGAGAATCFLGVDFLAAFLAFGPEFLAFYNFIYYFIF